LPLDRHARRFLDLMASGSRERSGPPSVAQLRAAADALAQFVAPAERVARRDSELTLDRAVLPMRSYAPEALGDALAPGLIYFHGGGWISGSIASHDGICALLASEGQCRVLSVGYRLAPEHPFPAGLEDCRAAIDRIVANPSAYRVDSSRLGVAADSAGANLAISAMLGRAGRGEGLQLLLCPVLTALGRTPSRQALATGHLIEEQTLAALWEQYRIPGLSCDDVRISPLYAADFSGLPPAQIHSAEFDPLADEAALYAEALHSAGVDARFIRHSGLIHHFYGLGRVIPAANEAWRLIGRDLRAAFAQ
jgi:acetyl esterase/lipase